MNPVSVIIPAYNGALYIERAIASVIRQTHTDWELIVVNDGSTDRTPQIVTKYIQTHLNQEQSDRFIYISQHNQGVAVARNNGLKAAKGKYIAFLDQDDFFLPHKLQLQVNLLENSPALGLTNSGWHIVDKIGKTISTVKPWQNLPDLNSSALIIWKPVFLGAMLFRHSWLQKTSGFNSQLQQTSDVELVLRLATIGCQGDWIQQATVGYRQHENNVSRNTSAQAKELDRMLKQFFARDDIPAKIKALEAESRYQSLIWSAWRLYQTGYLKEMSHYLERSRFYSDRYFTATVLHWIKSFKQYAAEYGTTIDVNTLCNSLEWQWLIRKSLNSLSLTYILFCTKLFFILFVILT